MFYLYTTENTLFNHIVKPKTTLEFVLNLLWNLTIANIFVALSSSASFLTTLQIYLTYNTLYIFEAVEPLSLLFLFFVSYNTLLVTLNYYLQIFIPSVSSTANPGNFAKRTTLPLTFYSLYKLNTLIALQTTSLHLRK